MALRQAKAKFEFHSADTPSPSTGGQESPSPKRARKLDLIRSFSLADFITLSNAACGTGSMFFCLNFLENGRYHPYLLGAFVLLPLALVFDIADGWVARFRKRSSPFGADLDSLADVVSFNVAPAVLGFTLGMRGFYDCVILSFFVCAGISRLARYNVTAEELTTATGKVKYYQGFPVPTSLLLVLVLYIAYTQGAIFDKLWLGKVILGRGTFHPLSLMYFVFGSAMMSSRLHIPKP